MTEKTLKAEDGRSFNVGDTVTLNDAGPKTTAGLAVRIVRIEPPYLVTRDAHGMERHVLPEHCKSEA